MKFTFKTKKILSGALLFALLGGPLFVSGQVLAAPSAPAKCFNQLAGSVYFCNGSNTASTATSYFQDGNCYVYTSPEKGWVKQQDCSLSQFSSVSKDAKIPVAVATDPAACGKSIKACCDTNSASTTGDKPSDCGFIKRINDLIAFLSVIVGIACALGIIIGGIEYSMSGGDPKRAASGKDHITKAVIAVVLYGFLYFFLQFIVPGGFLNG